MTKGTMTRREVRGRMAKAAFAFLEANGLTTRQIATRAKLPYRSVYRWRAGDVPHDKGLDKLWKLVKAVGKQ
jgi:transposase